MPSASFSHTGLTNIGPLTTTFTPPASCISSPWIAYATTDSPSIFRGHASCVQFEGCVPSGSERDSIAPKNGVPTVNYYSPGNACPSDWQTVGTAVRSSGDTDPSWSPSVSGAFQSADWLSAHPRIGLLPLPYILANALEPGETAVQCCPSSMTFEPLAGCYSILPSYTVSQGCRVYFTGDGVPYSTVYPEVDGVTETQVLESFTAPPVSSAVSFEPSNYDEITAFEAAPPVLMVHRSSDAPATPGATSSSSSTSNVAARGSIRVAGTNWGDVSVLLGFVTVAMTVGAAMVML